MPNPYEDLVSALVRRRRALGLSQIDLTDAMGLADGYVGKLESGARIATHETLCLWAQTLGLKLELVPTSLPRATVRAIADRKSRPYAEHQARFKHAG